MSDSAENSDIEEKGEIEVKKSHKKKVSLEEKATKEKKPRTPAQEKAFQECLRKRAECIAKRKADAERLAEFEKKALEEKVVKKAVAIKKKTIKKLEVLDDISSSSEDEAPVRRPKTTPAPIKPAFPFKFV
jgi:hypothetical protein